MLLVQSPIKIDLLNYPMSQSTLTFYNSKEFKSYMRKTKSDIMDRARSIDKLHLEKISKAEMDKKQLEEVVVQNTQNEAILKMNGPILLKESEIADLKYQCAVAERECIEMKNEQQAIQDEIDAVLKSNREKVKSLNDQISEFKMNRLGELDVLLKNDKHIIEMRELKEKKTMKSSKVQMMKKSKTPSMVFSENPTAPSLPPVSDDGISMVSEVY